MVSFASTCVFHIELHVLNLYVSILNITYSTKLSFILYVSSCNSFFLCYKRKNGFGVAK